MHSDSRQPDFKLSESCHGSIARKLWSRVSIALRMFAPPQRVFYMCVCASLVENQVLRGLRKRLLELLTCVAEVPKGLFNP